MTTAEREEKAGWDTNLATPFRDLQCLPAIFHRVPNRTMFTASDEIWHYSIRADHFGDLEFISYQNRDGREGFRHFIQISFWTSRSSFGQSINWLSRELEDACKAEKELVDITDFLAVVRQLPYTTSLVPEGQAVEPTSLQWLGFDIIIEARGRGDSTWFLELGEPWTIWLDDGPHAGCERKVWSGAALPFPLHDLVPTYEVILDRDGVSLSSVYPAPLRFDGAQPNVVEQMKAYRHLSDDAINQLREFATDGKGWIEEEEDD